MASSNGINGSVQHLTKKSSDQLLSKFAEVGSDSGAGKRRRTRRVNDVKCESGGAVAERKWLIPPAGRKSAVLKKIGIGKSQQLRIRDFRNKSILGAIQKLSCFRVQSDCFGHHDRSDLMIGLVALHATGLYFMQLVEILSSWFNK